MIYKLKHRIQVQMYKYITKQLNEIKCHNTTASKQVQIQRMKDGTVLEQKEVLASNTAIHTKFLQSESYK